MSERATDAGVTCSVEGYDWLRSARTEWDALIEACACDPLFNGWAWRVCWWRAFAEAGDATVDAARTAQPHTGAAPADAVLHVLVLRNAEGRLDAVLPLYAHRAAVRGRLRCQRLELLGCSLRGGRSGLEMSEYCDGCVRVGCEQIAATLFAAAMLSLGWDDFSAQGVREDSWVQQHLLPALQMQAHGRLRLRKLDSMLSWGVPLTEGSDRWRERLSSNVRRRVIGQRDRVADARIQPIARTAFPAFVQTLNDYHVARWGRPVYSPQRLLFHERLLELLPDDALVATMLMSGAAPISVLYNLRLRNREYNLQSGFSADATQRLSPGYQHLGYAIERAASAGVGYFDMLGGDGRSRAYKADLGELGSTMWGWQVLRSPMLKVLYRLWDDWTAYRTRRAHLAPRAGA